MGASHPGNRLRLARCAAVVLHRDLYRPGSALLPARSRDGAGAHVGQILVEMKMNLAISRRSAPYPVHTGYWYGVRSTCC